MGCQVCMRGYSKYSISKYKDAILCSTLASVIQFLMKSLSMQFIYVQILGDGDGKSKFRL